MHKQSHSTNSAAKDKLDTFLLKPPLFFLCYKSSSLSPHPVWSLLLSGRLFSALLSIMEQDLDSLFVSLFLVFYHVTSQFSFTFSH